MNRYAIILAAGKGTRMKSARDDVSKVSFPILGQPLVKWVINALKPLNLTKTVTIVGFGGVMSQLIVQNDSEVVWQNEQKGTGHAVSMTEPILEGLEGETIICCGDTPLLTPETLKKFFDVHEKDGNALTILTAFYDNPTGYGRIVKNGLQVLKIVEQKDASEEEKQIKEVNAGVYIFDNKELFKCIHRLTPNNAAGEYYLTDVIGMFVNDGFKVGTMPVEDNDETLGINDRYQLSVAAKLLQRRINKAWMLSGVSILDSETTYISPSVTIGQDTTIYPGTFLVGNTVIGTGNVIGPDAYLENVTVGSDNQIVYSHLVDTFVGSKNTLGPYLRTRKNVIIKNGCHIGNFNELKNVVFSDGSKAAHLSYLGDAAIGENVNIGCGTIIANYDGVNKSHSDIGNSVFVGSGTILISPVTVGEGAFIAAGSTINKDVPSDDMAIARARQENKAGYAKVLRAKALAKKEAAK